MKEVVPAEVPVLLVAIGDVHRFHNAKGFRQWTGVVPASHRSANTQMRGIGITKAGPARVKRALYQAAQAARRYDPQLAAIYFKQMVDYGKIHKQATGAVMSHLASRIYTVLKEDRPYELADVDGRSVGMEESRQIIKERYTVPQEIRKRADITTTVKIPQAGKRGSAPRQTGQP